MFGPQFTVPDNNATIGNGVLSTFTTPDSMQASGLASQRQLGPITINYNDPVLQYAEPALARAIQYGESEESDQSSNWQMTYTAAPNRFRSYLGYHFERAFVHGSHVFNSLVKTSAGDDKITPANPAILNIIHLQRALMDARRAAGMEAAASDDDKMIEGLTAFSPADFAQKWGYMGTCVEPSDSNDYANEPLWGVTAPGKGVVKMANFFGTDVQLGDELFMIVRFVDLNRKFVSNVHTPQPKQLLEVRGYSIRGQPARNSSKTSTPTEYDIDSIQRDVSIARHWTVTSYDPTALPGQRFVKNLRDTDPSISLNGVGPNAEHSAGRLKFDLYRQGFVVRVGIVSHVVYKPMNPSSELLEAAHYDIDSYKKLPLISVAPFVRRR